MGCRRLCALKEPWRFGELPLVGWAESKASLTELQALNGKEEEDEEELLYEAMNPNPFQPASPEPIQGIPEPPPGLDESQQAAFRAIVRAVLVAYPEDQPADAPSPKLVILHGGPGCGKSFLMKSARAAMALREHGKTIAGATTGIAAVNIDGETVSRLCLLYKAELVEKDVAALKKLFTGVHGLFIDEMSMLRASELSLVERRLRLATGSPLPFGGIAVILVGDFFQLPPVKGVRLFARAAGGKPHEDRSIGDFALFELGQQHRVDSGAPGAQAHIDRINRMRDPSTCEQAIKELTGTARRLNPGDSWPENASLLVASNAEARDKSVVQAVKPILERCGQTGVGMKSGADAMVCAMRCVGEAYRRDGQGRGILKVDLQNAFNKVSREAILQAVAESAPGLLPYAIAAYGRRSRLSFGEEVVWSECGVQQGDPLGPLFFCLVLEKVLRKVDLSLAERLPPLGANDIPQGALAPAQPQEQQQQQPQQQDMEVDGAGAGPANPVQEPAPPVQVPAPPVQVPAPPVQAPAPPVQEPAPPAQPDALRVSQLDARAFYLDDGAAAGLWEHLIAWLAAFELEGGAVGMHLNRGKSEVVCLAGERVPDEFAAMTRCSLESWEILGAPCGSEAAVREAVAKVLDRAEKRARAIASLPDPHTALALLNSCAGFVCVVSLMRATGPVADYGRVDAFMRRALARTLGAELGDTEWVQASLPLRLGGLGMHSCADSAAVAGVAATLEGIKGLPLLTRAPGGGPLQITLTQDSVCAASLACPRLALFPEVLTEVRDSLQAGAAGAPRKQKEWSGKISGARQAGLLRDPLVGVRGQARIRSCAAKHASTWLYGAHNAPDDLWMSPAELTVAVRLRLGMQLAPQARECRLCGAAEADRFGDHSLTCLNAGLRTRAHTALRNEVGALAREALLCPVLEDRPFTKHPHRNKRVDVAYTRGEKRRLIDVAITFPLQANAVKKAAETEGGAATKYEAVKRRTYDGPILAEAPEQQDLLLVPMVVDTFGAWGESALPELRALVNAVHRRHDWETYAAVSHLAFHRLSFVVARAVARIALVNADVHLGARRVEEGELELDEISTDDGAGSSSSSSSSSGSSSGGGGGSSSSNSSSSVASGGGGGGGAPEGGGGGAPGGPQAPAAQGPPPLPPPNDEQSQEGGQGEQGDEGRAPGAQAAPRGQVQGEVMPITGGVEEAEATRKDILKPLEAGRAGTASSRDGWRCAPPRATPSEPYRQRPRSMGTKRDPLGVEDGPSSSVVPPLPPAGPTPKPQVGKKAAAAARQPSKAAAARQQQQQDSSGKTRAARQLRQGNSGKAAAARQQRQGGIRKAAAARQQQQGSSGSKAATARQQQ
ncbi:ATP-dependent DNA helicase pif1 [Diplonema papillatum]|nr:ATP-dependent DNA helicase pif1 [Diplonema papillatum]